VEDVREWVQEVVLRAEEELVGKDKPCL
jgi:hypothetical protein